MTQQDNYTPFEDNYQQNDDTTYIPFQDGVLLESQGYYQVKGKQKCEYCGKPAQHANCHAHHKWCPYYCGNNHNDMSIGSDWILLIFIPIYLIIKKLWRK